MAAIQVTKSTPKFDGVDVGSGGHCFYRDKQCVLILVMRTLLTSK